MIVRLMRPCGQTVPAFLVREEGGTAVVHYVERTPPPKGWIGRDYDARPHLARAVVSTAALVNDGGQP